VTGSAAGASSLQGQDGSTEGGAGAPILRHIDWIWRVRGEIELAPGLSGDEAFDRLDPLFREPGTSHDRSGDTLVFTKKDPAAQDKMSVFDSGVLRVEQTETASVLRYRLNSRALLFCFLAPLLFLAVAGVTIAVGIYDQPTAAEVAEAKKKAEKKKDIVRPYHPIDKLLGAPEPEKPKTKEEKARDKKAKGAKDEEDDKKPSPVPAYVFAGIFAALYVVGRWLEAWLINRLFRKRLADA
jgi:hypothetical protein